MKKKGLIHIIGFLMLFSIIFITCEKIFFNQNQVSSVWEKLDEKQIDVLMMGNSHMYTTLNAKVLSDAMGLEIDVLASGSQYMEQTLENLKVVLKYQTPKYIILETNCSYGDNKEKMRGESIGLMLQNSDGIANYWYKLQSVLRTYKLKDVFTAMFQLVRPTEMWSRLDDFSERKNHMLDMNGYRSTNSIAFVEKNMQDVQSEYEQRYQKGEKTLLTIYNENALREFLQITKENNIEVWVYKGPTTRSGYAKHALAIEEICREYSNVAYIDDMHFSLMEIGLGKDDWYDSGHLNRAGAEKTTRYYGELLARRMDLHLNWDTVFAYSGESVKQTENGTYLYTMENYSKDCLYKFVLRVNGEVLEVQDYSVQNTFESEYDVRTDKTVEIYCSMIPTEDVGLGDKSENKINTNFMKQNDCIIE